jgi:hypothetical protein
VNAPTPGRWSSPAAGILAVAVLVEVVLFAGHHAERWRKSLAPLRRPALAAGEGLVIRCDGHGYYAWLRSLLVDGDWSFDNEFDEHNPLGDWVPPAAPRTRRGLRPNRWSVGPACLWALTVAPAHLAFRSLRPLGWPWAAQGYELPYQLLVGLTTLLASVAGLGFLYAACRRYAPPARAALAAALLTLGTTIVFYSAVEVAMAHGPGAAAVAALVCYWLRTYGSRGAGRWLAVGVLVGVAALMRWQLVTFALLPAGECLLACLRTRRLDGRPVLGLALAGLGAAAAFLPQLVAWRAVYGDWLPAPVATAHNWFRPAWWRVLLSSDRGLFYWTPLTVLALAGFARWRRTGADAARGEPLVLLLAAFVLQAYVVASLWGAEVQLGVSFGLRHLTESAVALGPGLALLLGRAGRAQFRLLCGLGCLLVLWNLLLICQYRYGLVPADAGASAGHLLANAARLVVRKKLLVAGQALLGPALLWLLAGRSAAGPAAA